MRFILIGFLAFLSVLSTPQKAEAMYIDRESRVIFNFGLPSYCASGWNGRGIGVVAVCGINWRRHVRFIDGYVLPCMYPDCRDRAPRINNFLDYNGF